MGNSPAIVPAADEAPADVVEVPADVLVAGSGIAGLTAALDAAEQGLRVLVVTRDRIGDGSTGWAQGGLAVVGPRRPVPGDSVALHVRDTLIAGAGLTDPVAAASILAEADAAVTDLLGRGAVFDTDDGGGWRRTREGGHSAARVMRAGGDATGAEISRALVSRARTHGLVVLEGHRMIGLRVDVRGRVSGADVRGPGGRRLVIPARAVVLATGGVGQLFHRSTNPPVATGDGIALALRAGAQVADLEFIQFHPTALAVPAGADGSVPLVTEAVRGEGGVLRDGHGRPLMSGVHPDRDLAPRDVVALTISRYLRGSGEDFVGLDARGIPGFAGRFPTVAHACARAGVDPARDLIPVAPAAHYLCGGVSTDLYGRSTVPGLYAVGEVARTGLHGANRLASNSLLEGLVMGRRSARTIGRELAGPLRRRADAAVLKAALEAADGPAGAVVRRAAGPRPQPGAELAGAGSVRARIRAVLSANAGIGRDAAGLEEAANALHRAAGELHGRDDDHALMLLTASAVVAAAQQREESRGCHQRTDRPGASEQWQLSTRWLLADRHRDDSLRGSWPAEVPAASGRAGAAR